MELIDNIAAVIGNHIIVIQAVASSTAPAPAPAPPPSAAAPVAVVGEKHRTPLPKSQALTGKKQFNLVIEIS